MTVVSRTYTVASINPPPDLIVTPPATGFATVTALRLGNYTPFPLTLSGVNSLTTPSYVLAPFSQDVYEFDHTRGGVTVSFSALSGSTTLPSNLFLIAEFADVASDLSGSYPVTLSGETNVNVGSITGSVSISGPVTIAGGAQFANLDNSVQVIPTTVVTGAATVLSFSMPAGFRNIVWGIEAFGIAGTYDVAITGNGVSSGYSYYSSKANTISTVGEETLFPEITSTFNFEIDLSVPASVVRLTVYALVTPTQPRIQTQPLDIAGIVRLPTTTPAYFQISGGQPLVTIIAASGIRSIVIWSVSWSLSVGAATFNIFLGWGGVTKRSTPSNIGDSWSFPAGWWVPASTGLQLAAGGVAANKYDLSIDYAYV